MDAGVKQRRPTEKQFPSVGGAVLPLRNWYCTMLGVGDGRLPPAAMPAPAGPNPSAAAPANANAATRRPV